jgi:hypothetical protein
VIDAVRSLFALACCALLICAACAGQPKFDGDWEGDDWGTVSFVGTRGSYSSTYGPDRGEIRLQRTEDGSYEGTWGEGERRHGKLKLRFESGDVLVGEWTADDDSTLTGSKGGIIRWNRRK